MAGITQLETDFDWFIATEKGRSRTIPAECMFFWYDTSEQPTLFAEIGTSFSRPFPWFLSDIDGQNPANRLFRKRDHRKPIYQREFLMKYDSIESTNVRKQ